MFDNHITRIYIEWRTHSPLVKLKMFVRLLTDGRLLLSKGRMNKFKGAFFFIPVPCCDSCYRCISHKPVLSL